MKDKIILILISFLIWILPFFESDYKSAGFFILISVAGLMGLFIKWKEIKFDFVDTLFAFFLFISLVSAIFSAGFLRSFLETLRYVSYFIIFIYVKNSPENSRKFAQRIFISALIFLSVYFSIVAFSFYLKIPLLNIPSNGMNLYYLKYGHNKLIDLLLFSVPIQFILFTENPDKSKKRIFWDYFIFFILIVSAVSTISKSGYMVLIGVITFFCLDIKINKSILWMRKVHLLILPLFVMYILIVVSSYIPILANNPVLKLFHKPLFSDYRWDYIKISIQGAFSSPITGIGLDNYRFINKIWQSLPYSWSAHGENHYLTLFTETGFMGGGIFLIMTFSILFYIYKHISADKLSDAGIFLALLASSLHVLFNPDWQFLSIFLYFFIGAGLLTSGSNLRSNYKFEGFNLPAKNISIFMMVLGITNVFGISFYYIGLKYNSPKLLSVSSFLSPGNIYLHSLLGNYYYQENDYEKAGKEYDLVSRMDPLEYSFYIRQGQINLVNGQLYMYEHNFLKAVYLDPKELQFYLVEAYKQLLNSADKALVNNNLVLSQEHISLSRDLFPEFSEIVMNDIDFIASLNEFKDTQTTREIEFIKKYINDGQKLDKYKSISSEKIKIMLLKLEENRQKIIDITSKKS